MVSWNSIHALVWMILKPNTERGMAHSLLLLPVTPEFRASHFSQHGDNQDKAGVNLIFLVLESQPLCPSNSSVFSSAVIKYHNPKQLRCGRVWFSWVYSSRERESIRVGKIWQQTRKTWCQDKESSWSHFIRIRKAERGARKWNQVTKSQSLSPVTYIS